MTFTFAPAIRERVSLLISIAGVSGSGKTLSALKVARGLADGDDSRVAFIDTEAKRALHYAVAPGESPGEFKFAFQHADMRPPFSPEHYTEAIQKADAAGFEVVVIDSASHLWEGEGGVQDMHAAILEEQVEQARKNHRGNWEFDPVKTADRLSVGAWKGPKGAHKRFVSKLLQVRCHVVLCLRADEKMRMEKVRDDRGRERTVITQAKDLPPAERWSPICEKRLPYEMTVSFVLSPERPGFPIPIKLQEQHRAAVPLDRPLSEDTGRALARWARGGTDPAQSSRAGTSSPASQAPLPDDAGDDFPGDRPADPVDDLIDRARSAAMGGMTEYRTFFEGITKEQRLRLTESGEHDRCKSTAEQADKR